MNQEQVTKKLLRLDSTVDKFKVTFSGKESKKVDGLYYPDNCEIIIHNKNFEDDNLLMYTAIHEFAHHIQFTRSALPVSSRAHTNQFWDILHKLLFKAEDEGVYVNVFEKDSEFIEITTEIRDKYLSVNTNLMVEFGKLLMRARKLCIKNNASFEDYVDRVLKLQRTTAKTIIKVAATDINPEIGFENMATVAKIKDEDIRKLAEEAFIEGKSPDMVKAEYSARKKPDDKLEQLIVEKDRIEKSLENLTVKLAKIEQQIDEFNNE